MANCGLNEKPAEHVICRVFVANMPMATSKKKGGNTEWEKNVGKERTTFNFARVDGENFTDCKMSVRLFHFHRMDMLQWTRGTGLLDQYRDYAMSRNSRESGVDYLLEQRFISMPLLPGVPCSITYWSKDLSLSLYRLEHT